MSTLFPPKKHKKHKSDRKERYENGLEKSPSLKLILKVGSQNTPEHVPEFGNLSSFNPQEQGVDSNDPYSLGRSHHKKSKKKKKKKDKCKDREKKHKHHHKDKKRKREDADIDQIVLSPYPVLGSPSQHREPRTCVLKKIQEKSALQKSLEHLLGLLEKKDPQQFFAWPVTDNFAPGYSTIITQPMDFSTMRQKIEENLYDTLQDFIADFKLICTNAMKYNHADTVYYKTAKKLLGHGLKMLLPEKLGWLFHLIPELTSQDVGFEITPELRLNKHRDEIDDEHIEPKRKMPITKFEAIPDELTPEEILLRSQNAAREARRKLVMKKGGVPMGFLKQRRDGTTNLNILVGGDGVIPGTKKRPVLLGQLTGKLSEGSNQMQGFREDRRNIVKPVKSLDYGAFSSYAPSYDSTFANLTKEESELVYQTYGSETAMQYAESIMNFVKDSDYTTHLVDSLLDLLTGGDHSKTKKTLEDNKKLREEEEAVKTVMEAKPISEAVKIDVDELKSLKELGIDVSFLEKMDSEIRQVEERFDMQQKLNSMCELLDKLHRTQYTRLSAPPPLNLADCPGPSDEEQQLAERVTSGLAEISARARPQDVVPVAGVRRALGVAVTEADLAADPVQCDLDAELRRLLECEQIGVVSQGEVRHSPMRDGDGGIEDMLLD